jgi:predicted ArsR family transcriptional regulator
MATKEYQKFVSSMGTILKADPEAVKAAMDAEKRERQLEAQRTGKRGRGRPPKQSSSSGRVPSETD